jgi:hypothetical protein
MLPPYCDSVTLFVRVRHDSIRFVGIVESMPVL